MSKIQYGEVENWDDLEINSGGFMKLEEGKNIVRVITNPYQFMVAWVTDESGANKKIKSAIKNCPLVKLGHKIQKRWYIGVIERKTNSAKILEVSAQILTSIKSLVKDPDWGPVANYDININRGPKGSQPLYTVFPKPPTQLSDEDKIMIKAFQEDVDLNKMVQPPTPEEVAEQLGISSSKKEKESKTTNIDDSTFEFDDDEL